MIDILMYRQLHSEESDETVLRDDLGQEAMDQDEPPDGPFTLLLPANIWGFGFHNKKWSR
jgi:hypothetical protein